MRRLNPTDLAENHQKSPFALPPRRREHNPGAGTRRAQERLKAHIARQAHPTAHAVTTRQRIRHEARQAFKALSRLRGHLTLKGEVTP